MFTCISLTADTVDVAMTTISYKVPTKCLTGPICRFGVRDHGDRWQQQTISIGRAKITALSIHHAVCSFGQPCIWQRKTVPTAKCFFQVRQLGYLYYAAHDVLSTTTRPLLSPAGLLDVESTTAFGSEYVSRRTSVCTTWRMDTCRHWQPVSTVAGCRHLLVRSGGRDEQDFPLSVLSC